MTDHRQELIEALKACCNFVITAKTGAIRAYPRGPVLGHVECDRDPWPNEWWAYVEDVEGVEAAWSPGAKGRKESARKVLAYRRSRIVSDFLVGLIERHPDRLGAIREAIRTPWRDDPCALGGLCSEDDLEKAMRAVAINRSVREAA